MAGWLFRAPIIDTGLLPPYLNAPESKLDFRFFFAIIRCGRGNGKRSVAPLPFGLSRAAGRLIRDFPAGGQHEFHDSDFCR